MGFTFDRLGCRVPAIAVSAYTRAGTIIHDEMHHGSVIATLSRLHGLRPLTRRDAGANDLFSVGEPRTSPETRAPGPSCSRCTCRPTLSPTSTVDRRASPHKDEAAQPSGPGAARPAAGEVRRRRPCRARDLRAGLHAAAKARSRPVLPEDQVADATPARRSAQQHRAPGLAQDVGDIDEELRALLAVDQAVVERQARAS